MSGGAGARRAPPQQSAPLTHSPLATLDRILSENSFLGSRLDVPTQTDVHVFRRLTGTTLQTDLIHLHRWFAHLNSYR